MFETGIIPGAIVEPVGKGNIPGIMLVLVSELWSSTASEFPSQLMEAVFEIGISGAAVGAIEALGIMVGAAGFKADINPVGKGKIPGIMPMGSWDTAADGL